MFLKFALPPERCLLFTQDGLLEADIVAILFQISYRVFGLSGFGLLPASHFLRHQFVLVPFSRMVQCILTFVGRLTILSVVCYTLNLSRKIRFPSIDFHQSFESLLTPQPQALRKTSVMSSKQSLSQHLRHDGVSSLF